MHVIHGNSLMCNVYHTTYTFSLYWFDLFPLTFPGLKSLESEALASHPFMINIKEAIRVKIKNIDCMTLYWSIIFMIKNKGL